MATLRDNPNYRYLYNETTPTPSSTVHLVVPSITPLIKTAQPTNVLFKIILVPVLVVIMIFFIDIFIRKRIWETVVKKLSFSTVILLMILLILLTFVVFPKGYGYYTCFKGSYGENVRKLEKGFDFLYRYCRKELDSKGNYYFENK